MICGHGKAHTVNKMVGLCNCTYSGPSSQNDLVWQALAVPASQYSMLLFLIVVTGFTGGHSPGALTSVRNK